ncbi:hypothetical protein OIU74_025889 [Salix koriyanagi]|uniref:Uncharacterized protein n=1 Tax=Salix koriyanagi TaxID=2511006 RepID=A0A9Q0W2A5_9ROSI|nr:hypothetical protein OIU74_025889 [Salix koriyanagi]
MGMIQRCQVEGSIVRFGNGVEVASNGGGGGGGGGRGKRGRTVVNGTLGGGGVAEAKEMEGFFRGDGDGTKVEGDAEAKVMEVS